MVDDGLAAASLSTNNLYAEKNSKEKESPSINFEALSAREEPVGTGNFHMTIRCLVKTKAAIDADEVDPVDNSDALVSAVTHTLNAEDLADRMMAAVDNLTVFGFSDAGGLEMSEDGDHWVEIWVRDIYCNGMIRDPFYIGGSSSSYTDVPGDPLLFQIFQYDLVSTRVGDSAYLTWTYPASGAPDAALTTSLQMSMWLQRSYYKTNNPLAPDFWSLNVPNGNEPVENGWDTLKTWNPGEDFPAEGLVPQFEDTDAFPNGVHIANYRLVTKYFTGGTWNEIDWNIASEFKNLVLTATLPNQTQVDLSWS